MHWDLLDGCHWGTELQLLIRTKQGKGHTCTLFSPTSLFRFSCCNSLSHREGGTSPWVAHTLHYRARSLWSQRTVRGTYWRQGNRLEMKVGQGRTQSLGLGNSRYAKSPAGLGPNVCCAKSSQHDSNESCHLLSNYYVPDTELSTLGLILFTSHCNHARQRQVQAALTLLIRRQRVREVK